MSVSKQRRVRTCTSVSSLKAAQAKVGVVPKKPLSVTSSTVSPMDSTNVAFMKDTIMYASNSSATTKEKNTHKLYNKTNTVISFWNFFYQI